MSARIAGNDRGYRLSLVDKDGQARGASVELTSVTTILQAMPKHGLEWWGYKIGLQAARCVDEPLIDGVSSMTLEELYELAKRTPHTPQKALRSAGDRGTDVHELAEELLKTGKLELPIAGESGYVRALLDWYGKVRTFEVVEVEVPLFSIQHRYAGTCDYILRDPFDGTYVVGDFKTSKAIYDSHLIQTAAYAHAARELGLIPSGAAVRKEVVRLGADGTHEVRLSGKTLHDFLVVKAMHELLSGKD